MFGCYQQFLFKCGRARGVSQRIEDATQSRGSMGKAYRTKAKPHRATRTFTVYDNRRRIHLEARKDDLHIN